MIFIPFAFDLSCDDVILLLYVDVKYLIFLYPAVKLNFNFFLWGGCCIYAYFYGLIKIKLSNNIGHFMSDMNMLQQKDILILTLSFIREF